MKQYHSDLGTRDKEITQLKADLASRDSLIVEKDKALRYAKESWLQEHGNNKDWPVPDIINTALSLTPEGMVSEIEAAVKSHFEMKNRLEKEIAELRDALSFPENEVKFSRFEKIQQIKELKAENERLQKIIDEGVNLTLRSKIVKLEGLIRKATDPGNFAGEQWARLQEELRVTLSSSTPTRDYEGELAKLLENIDKYAIHQTYCESNIAVNGVKFSCNCGILAKLKGDR